MLVPNFVVLLDTEQAFQGREVEGNCPISLTPFTEQKQNGSEICLPV